MEQWESLERKSLFGCFTARLVWCYLVLNLNCSIFLNLLSATVARPAAQLWRARVGPMALQTSAKYPSGGETSRAHLAGRLAAHIAGAELLSFFLNSNQSSALVLHCPVSSAGY
jgi:hypothetical protein